MMFNRSKAWALALLAAVFAAGIGAGWTLQAWADQRDGGRRTRGSRAMVEHLTRELELTPVQQDSVRAIVERSKGAFDALWREVHPRYDSLKQRVRAEIRAQLTPAQQERYLQLLAAREHQHRKEDSAKDSRSGGRN